jgi:hypothetical protein
VADRRVWLRRVIVVIAVLAAADLAYAIWVLATGPTG